MPLNRFEKNYGKKGKTAYVMYACFYLCTTFWGKFLE